MGESYTFTPTRGSLAPRCITAGAARERGNIEAPFGVLGEEICFSSATDRAPHHRGLEEEDKPCRQQTHTLLQFSEGRSIWSMTST
jgi:hypothetical protein